MGHAAPITRFALAFALGVASRIVGAPLGVAPLVALLRFAPPIGTSPGLHRTRTALLAFSAGLIVAAAAPAPDPGACPDPEPGRPAGLTGRFVATPRSGSAPLEREDGCGLVTVVLDESITRHPDSALAGRRVHVVGVWQEGTRRFWVRGTEVEALDGAVAQSGSVRLRWMTVRWRDGLVARLHRLYGDRAPIVAALALARREGLDPDVREGFAVAGIAHLLAISGFHVGVIAGLALGALRTAGVRRRPARILAAACAWLYVGLIGFPSAACRAAVILGAVGAAECRGKPATRWGPLSAAALLLLTADPLLLASPGFQLSFAGAIGLVAWSRDIDSVLRRAVRLRRPNPLTGALGAGVAATVATLPIVAWHFGRVSAVGIPMTLAATPLVSLALPGVLASLALDVASPAAGSFLAAGVTVLLDTLVGLAGAVTERPWASVWLSRPTVVASLAGVGVATIVARQARIGRRARRTLVLLYVAGGWCAWPVARSFEGRGRLELLMIDVGQGDALAVRTPRGRWILVDAGPEADAGGGRRPEGARAEAGPHPVVRTLRSRGVRRIELLILTHPDLDHFGGARAVLSAFEVGRVVDPALPAAKAPYAALLADAGRRGIPWAAARAGQSFTIDGVDFRVLSPGPRELADGESNEASVVLQVSWGPFDALLTGDAYVEVERRLAEVVPRLDVLKVGHHGSATSTDPLLLAAARPDVALLSVGRRNRYGHPAPEVMRRLDEAGARVFRTDRDGAIRVVVGRDGLVRIVTGR